MSEKYMCIYHGNCADGFGAAWAVRDWYCNSARDIVNVTTLEFYAGVYQQEPPDVTGYHVIMVDFSYKRNALEAMAEKAESILVLDHHKSAMDDLMGYPDAIPTFKVPGEGSIYDPQPGIWVEFDMERSGAMMAWDYFHDGEAPRLIEHIQDRDLWRFDLPYTREIQAALVSHPYDFDLWDDLMCMDSMDMMIREGRAIERKHHKDIAELVDVCQRFMKIGGWIVPVASLPYTHTSDAGHLMADSTTFAACYWDTADARIFSLRSQEDGMDVSKIAMQYGGGGHKNAAGFSVPREHELAKA